MQIEEGKYYKTRDGRKVGPMKRAMPYRSYDFCGHDGVMDRIFQKDGEHGSSYIKSDYDLDLIAEWPTGPVVTETVTKTRIVPGTYGKVSVGDIDIDHENKFVKVQLLGSVWINADELDAAAAVLSALAKGLRDVD